MISPYSETAVSHHINQTDMHCESYFISRQEVAEFNGTLTNIQNFGLKIAPKETSWKTETYMEI
jgi:hypothetical protein